MKRNHVLIAAAILVIALISVSVYISNKPIYVGFTAGLSGQRSQFGVQIRNGFLQAVDDINAQGGINGREVVPLVMDDKNDNAFADELIVQMQDKDVDFLIGFTLSSMTPSVQSVMEKTDILIISPTISTNALAELDDNFFRVCNTSISEAYILADILNQDNRGDVAILYDIANQQYTKPTRDKIVELAPTLDLNISFDKGFNSKDVNHVELVEETLNSGAEHIVILASGVDTAQIAQRVRASGSDALLYANAWATTQDLLENGGNAVNGLKVVGLYDISSTEPSYQRFKDTMIERYGDTPTFTQIFAYESLYVLKTAIEHVDSFDAEKVKQAIIEIETFDGLQQTVRIDEFGDAHRDYTIYIVENNEFKVLE